MFDGEYINYFPLGKRSQIQLILLELLPHLQQLLHPRGVTLHLAPLPQHLHQQKSE